MKVTEINNNVKDKILEISCKIFTNDLEVVLEKGAKTKVDLSNSKEKATTDKLIDEYIERHLRLKVDGKAAGMHFLGSEKGGGGNWGCFQVKHLRGGGKVDAGEGLLLWRCESKYNKMQRSWGR